MPTYLDPNDWALAGDVEENHRWVGFFENRRGTVINLGNPILQRTLALESSVPERPDQGLCVCIFNCPTSSSISGFDKFHRLTRSNHPASFQITNELKQLGFFRALDEIRPNLSGLTKERLLKVREGMRSLNRTLRTTNYFKSAGGLEIVGLQENRIYSWEGNHEFRTGKI